jgi:hypothetical protein
VAKAAKRAQHDVSDEGDDAGPGNSNKHGHEKNK